MMTQNALQSMLNEAYCIFEIHRNAAAKEFFQPTEFVPESVSALSKCPLNSPEVQDSLRPIGGESLVNWAWSAQFGAEFFGSDPEINREELLQPLIFDGLMYEHRKSTLLEVQSAFDTHAIEFLILKGMAACLDIYKGIEEIRPMSDIDVLVHPQNFSKAAEKIEELGFTLQSRRTDLSGRFISQVSLHRSEGQFGVAIDLHCAAHNWPLLAGLTDLAFEERQTINSFPVLSPIASIAWICAHRMKDEYFPDIRGLLDFRVYLSKLNLTEFYRLVTVLESLGLTRSAVTTAIQSKNWLGDTDPGNTNFENQLILLSKPATGINDAEMDGTFRPRSKLKYRLPNWMHCYFGALRTSQLRGTAVRAMALHASYRLLGIWKN